MVKKRVRDRDSTMNINGRPFMRVTRTQVQSYPNAEYVEAYFSGTLFDTIDIAWDAAWSHSRVQIDVALDVHREAHGHVRGSWDCWITCITVDSKRVKIGIAGKRLP